MKQVLVFLRIKQSPVIMAGPWQFASKAGSLNHFGIIIIII
jgi:hypothetical protein